MAVNRDLNSDLGSVPEHPIQPVVRPTGRRGGGGKKTVSKKVVLGCALGLVGLFVIPMILIGIFADSDDEDMVNQVSKDASVVVTFSTKHIDPQNDILITHYDVYKDNRLITQFDLPDTVPALGNRSMAKNSSVPPETEDTRDTVSDYDVFVTIK